MNASYVVHVLEKKDMKKYNECSEYVVIAEESEKQESIFANMLERFSSERERQRRTFMQCDT
jgi:hypothetical protein